MHTISNSTETIQSSPMALYCILSSNSHLHSSILSFLIITVLFIFPSITYSSIETSFNFSTFRPNDPLLSLESDASIVGNYIELTKNSTGITNSVGRVTYTKAIQLWDPFNGRLADFETQFSFLIQSLNDTSYGDGMAFFLAPFKSKIPPKSGGGFLGLMSSDVAEKNFTTNETVAVEFDTFKNDWDFSPDHVGINVNSIRSVANVSLAKDVMKNGTIAKAWVNYNATVHNLSVILTYEHPGFCVTSGLHHIVDLRNVLPELITVGFSATAGTASEYHNIISWQFNCNIKNKKDANTLLVVGLIVGLDALGCLIGFAIFIWWSTKRRRARNSDLDAADSEVSMDDAFEKGTGPKRFLYRELVYATNNFHEAGKLGEGGFGGVYRGFLSGINLDIAVKRISKGSQQGKREYQSEVKIISQLRHRNLVQLIGWSHERNELLLVYEFMPNRSLDKHLFRGVNILTWEVRYKIALGLASALLYLHELWEQCVLHRDIKSSNVMLDSDFNAKLGDFGLARLVDHQLGSQTTVLAGTLGYLAPECIYTSKSSKESDVFSFGIVALEIACGRKPVEQNKENLVDWVWELYANGKIVEAADKRLNMDFDGQQMEHLLVLGLWCAHPDPTTRPSIRQVKNLLNYEVPLVNLPTKLPSPVYNYAPRLRMYKLAWDSAYGDHSSSQRDGSQCRCSNCSNANPSQMSTEPSAGSSSSESLIHSC